MAPGGEDVGDERGAVGIGVERDLETALEWYRSAGAQDYAAANDCVVETGRDPAWAAGGADVVYTDVWTSMGWEEETQRRHIAFQSFQVDDALMAKAGPEAIFMHCLPAFHNRQTRLGEEVFQKFGLGELEVTEEVFESGASIVFDEAENRLHTQKALLEWLIA